MNEEAAALVGDARREAERRRAAAVADAEGMLADARQRAEVVRAAAASQAVEAAAAERATLLDAARRDADDHGGAADRLSSLVDRVVAVVRAAGVDRERAR